MFITESFTKRYYQMETVADRIIISVEAISIENHFFRGLNKDLNFNHWFLDPDVANILRYEW